MRDGERGERRGRRLWHMPNRGLSASRQEVVGGGGGRCLGWEAPDHRYDMAQRLDAGPEGSAVWGTDCDALLQRREDVHDVVRRVLGQVGTAEDVVQETLLRALQHQATVERDRAGAWLTVVGRRLAVDELRGRQRLDVHPEPHDRPSLDADPADIAERRELLAQIGEAFRALSPRQRRLLLRQLGGGVSLAELATEEHTTVASVRSVLARAREVIRANLYQSGWLVAGLLPRLLAAARSPADRLIARLERAVPLVPQIRQDTTEALTAAAAALALLLAPSAAPERPRSDHDGRTQAATPVGTPGTVPGTTAAPVKTTADSLSESALAALRARIPTGTSANDQPDVVIPFQDFGGDVTQFAVAPDQQTVFAIGGWVETEESANESRLKKSWEPVFYRSDDGGRRWQRMHVPGFLPGRIMFAPTWPHDPRVFVVLQDGVLRSDDGGRTFNRIRTETETIDPTRPGERVRAPTQDPETTIREQQEPPKTPTLRPAAMSPSFAQGDEVIYVGNPAEMFDARLGISEPIMSLPPWAASHGIAPAPDHATSGGVLVGAAVNTDVASRSRGAIFHCRDHRCEKMHQFDDMGTAPGIYVSPNEPDLVYAWTTYVAYRSADGGRTWTRQQLGPLLDLVEVGGRLVFLSMSGVPISDDRGATWRQLRVVYSISAVAPIGPSGLLLAAGPGMACSPDGGDHWLPNCPAV